MADLVLAAAGVGCEWVERERERTERRVERELDQIDERVQQRFMEADTDYCRRLIPEPTRQRFFPGLQASVGDKLVAGSVTCRFMPEGGDPEARLYGPERGAEVNVSCSLTPMTPESIEEATHRYRSGERVDGFGRLALRWGSVMVILWRHDPSQLLPFARELERSLTPDLLPTS